MATSTNISCLSSSFWSYSPVSTTSVEEIRIWMPSSIAPRAAYKIVREVGQYLEQKVFNKNGRLDREVFFTIQSRDEPLNGRWKFKPLQNEGFLQKVLRCLWINRIEGYKNVAILEVEKLAPVDTGKAIFPPNYKFVHESSILETPSFGCAFESVDEAFLSERIAQRSPVDSFMQLATEAFQAAEAGSIANIQGGHRFIIEEGSLKLVECDSTLFTATAIQENKNVVATFRKLVTQEYGIERIRSIECAHLFSFDQMIEKGEPLFIELIFLINTEVNSVGPQIIEEFYKKLLAFKKELSQANERSLLLWDAKTAGMSESQFSLRQMRGIVRGVREFTKSILKPGLPTVLEIRSFIENLIHESKASIEQLSVQEQCVLEKMIGAVQ